MSQNFPDKERARAYIQAHDDDAVRFSRLSVLALRDEERAALAAGGGRRLAGGPVSRDELVSSILELRHPLIAEARAVITGDEPGAALAMSDEDILNLVEDGSNDYVEGIGERGGYVSYSVEGGTLTVKVQAFIGAGDAADEADLDKMATTERKWRLVPVEAQ